MTNLTVVPTYSKKGFYDALKTGDEMYKQQQAQKELEHQKHMRQIYGDKYPRK